MPAHKVQPRPLSSLFISLPYGVSFSHSTKQICVDLLSRLPEMLLRLSAGSSLQTFDQLLNTCDQKQLTGLQSLFGSSLWKT